METTESELQKDEQLSAEEVEQAEILLSKTNPELYAQLKSRPNDLKTLIHIAQVVSESHEGPLPSPKTLKGYEETLPGAAERIFKMAEKEQDHAHKLNVEMVQGKIKQSGLGQRMGFIIAIFGLLVGFVCMMAGGYWDNSTLIITGGGVTGADLIALVALFLRSTSKRGNSK